MVKKEVPLIMAGLNGNPRLAESRSAKLGTSRGLDNEGIQVTHFGAGCGCHLP